MKKALMNASVASMIYKFNMDNIDMLEKLGYQVDVSCNFDEKVNPISKQEIENLKKFLKDKNIRIYETECPRNIFSIGKIVKTYKKLKKIADEEKYELVHTQSPIGGVICRLAFRNARKRYGTKVIYQAHGFHFYKGAPIHNWLFYYPIEKWCSKYTDILITITKEDYKRAKRKFNANKIVYVQGIGLDIDKFQDDQLTIAELEEFRKSIGIPTKGILLLSVGELNDNKNHEVVIKALGEIGDDSIFYVIAGIGDKKQQLQKLIDELGLQKNVKLIGFRQDVGTCYQAANIYILPSKREGLNVSIMEAMLYGKPCIAGKIRGNVDLIDEMGGELFDSNSVYECKKAVLNCIKRMRENSENMGRHNMEVIQYFSKEKVKDKMLSIYRVVDTLKNGD